MNENPKVSIIISSYNSIEALKECLAALQNQTYLVHEVIVVDAASTDGTTDILKNQFPWVNLLACKTRVGIGDAINQGINIATGDYIVFDLNCDDLVTPTWLERLVEVMEKHPEIGVVCGKRYYGTPTQYSGTPRLDSCGGRMLFGIAVPYGHKKTDGPSYESLKEVQYTAVAMTRREVLAKVGPLDEDFFIYGEDVDFSLRVRKAGYKVYVEPKALFWHQRSATVGEVSPTRLYYLSRSRVRLIMKHYGLLKRLLYITAYIIAGTFVYPTCYSYIGRQSPIPLLKAHYKGVLWNFWGSRNPAANLRQ
ncbi:MAG: hypothetical protein DK304_000232 [Chloroflexi bacterium]|jgi:GT2 family glycosyltransferase|nr:MAG: hypothetical protein DK304_000232 [Chloroflexota bacterium]